MRFTALLQESLATFGRYWKMLVGISLLLSFLPAVIITAVAAVHGRQPDPSLLLIGWLFSILLILSVVEHLRKPKGMEKTLRAALKRFWDGLLLTIVTTVLLALLFALFIVPGVIFSVYWTFAYFALVLDGKGVIGSLRHSTAIVRGNWWKVFGYLLLLSFLVIVPATVMLLPFFAWPPVFFAVSAAVHALALTFMLIFLERMYVVMR